jgi:tripartite-type tricarboxylate transporter receptor subunit TctC
MLVRISACMLASSAILLTSGVSCAQEYPDKPLRVVTSGMGGGTDLLARVMAQGISGPLKQPVVVDNRSGVAIGEIVAHARPDGHTLLVNGQAHWVAPLLQSTPYDAVKEFSPVSILDRSPSAITVHPSLPVKTVADLIALARAKPGQLNFPSTSAGSSGHISGELFKSMAKVNIVWVPYKAVGQAFADLMANQVQVAFISLGSSLPHITSGKLRGLAVASLKPSPLAPSLPPAASTGLPGYEAVSVTGVFVTAKTPAPVINRLSMEITRVFNSEDVKALVLKSGSEPVGSSPQELADLVKSDIEKYSRVIKEAGIKIE